MKTLLITVLTFCSCFTQAQRIVDTVDFVCGVQTLAFSIDTTFKRDKGHYDEGLLWTVFSADAEVYDISCGGLNQPMVLLDSSRYDIVETCINAKRTFSKGIDMESGLPWVYIKFHNSKFRVYARALKADDIDDFYRRSARFYLVE